MSTKLFTTRLPKALKSTYYGSPPPKPPAGKIWVFVREEVDEAKHRLLLLGLGCLFGGPSRKSGPGKLPCLPSWFGCIGATQFIELPADRLDNILKGYVSTK